MAVIVFITAQPAKSKKLYIGLLPALRILRPATEHPARRSGLMLGAHFLWGVSLCALHQLLLDDAQRGAPALQQRTMSNVDRVD